MSGISDRAHLLEVKHLTKRFPRVLANDCIDFSVFNGEIHCLLGENGAGKSTLAECLYGYYKHDEGDILFRGQPVDYSSPRDAIKIGIGMVHQHFSLVETLSAVENILLGDRTSNLLLNSLEVENTLNELCETYGVEINLNSPIWQLSVGEQQWVEILKALYVGVELLILDEPTAVLTPIETERLYHVLGQMKENGLTIILITHKLNEVMAVSDRVTILRKGKCVGTVSTSDTSKSALAEMMVGRPVIFEVEKGSIEPGETLLEIRELTAINDGGREVLRGINLTVKDSEILGLVGVAGNGQKELFEVLIGVRPALKGNVLLGGKEIVNSSPSEIMAYGISYIPDDRIKQGLIPDFKIYENLILGQQRDPRFIKNTFINAKSVTDFSRECVSQYEIITPSIDHPTMNLSGGNMQKVILARELSQTPDVLLASQPTRGLDVGAIEYVHTKLLQARDRGAAVLLASEDLDEIFSLADRIAVIFKGRIMDVFLREEAKIETIGLLMTGVTKKDL